MPNWCATTITINSKNIISLGYLFERLKEWTRGDKQFCDNGFGKNWLGNIVGFSGIGDPSNDPCEIGRYYMCSDFDCDIGWDSYDLLESQVIERLQEILKSKSSNINFLMSEAYKKADLEGIFLSIHRCEDVDIDEWD